MRSAQERGIEVGSRRGGGAGLRPREEEEQERRARTAHVRVEAAAVCPRQATVGIGGRVVDGYAGLELRDPGVLFPSQIHAQRSAGRHQSRDVAR